MHSFGSYKREWFSSCIVWLAALLISGIFFWLISGILWHGTGRITLQFLTSSTLNAGRSGGIAPIIVSTGLILLVCMSVAIPIGLGTAILLSEFTSNDNIPGKIIRRSLDVLAGIPSIVFGLFGNVFFCKMLGLGFSILSGGLTLACMVLPIFIRSVEEGLRSISIEYRLGAGALGLTKTATLFRVLLPLAVPAIVAGLTLGIGRALAETAALIFTSGYVDRYPESLFDSGRSLSIHIYDLSMNVAGGDKNAYSSALVLLVMVLVINELSTWISQHYLKHRTATE